MTSVMYRVDLRWGDGQGPGAITDRTITSDPLLALAAFRRLLRRPDLNGRRVAARFVLDGRSLYFSEFDAPIGRGRIHADAPLDPCASRDHASSLSSWLPAAAAHSLRRTGDAELSAALEPFAQAARSPSVAVPGRLAVVRLTEIAASLGLA